ncbi:hypothetical protein QTQ03_09930 [Micromonospora sp. WMMA1363]|uniref:hypothetical protein n=1 Tax=Micromonospora sp. WMMA1363 TaxID=3053985 RepID=UPI00259CDC68|nr:hypothetical protein [Micromonospora sp. WMMA1363]MDM4719881.1 hypothetical protein [Micromonospora sp. WMMA1363]
MTRAPENLLAVRALLLSHLNVDPNVVRDADLEPAEVGIVGDANHLGGYHAGSDRIVNEDYSVVESPRDSSGLTLDAAALDVGLFRVRSGAATHTLYTFSTWCVQQCAANAPDTRDIREIIYSPDGRNVRRWDRLRRRSTGDLSHLWHTHVSFFRDSIKAGRDQTPLFRRYLIHIGLLEDDMALSAEDLDKVRSATARGIYDALWVAAQGEPYRDLTYTGPGSIGKAIRTNLQALTVAPVLSALAAKDLVSEEQVVSGILAALTPEKIVAAIPPALARDVADELARRLAE